MKRKDLIDNIEGSRLKKQFLEAFLLQSTFIEGLLKKLIEDSFFSNVIMPILLQKSKDNNLNFNILTDPYINSLKEKILRQNLYDIIEHLAKSEIITVGLKKKLHAYRESRNGVLHDLVGKMSGQTFENELESLVTKGQEILQDESMIKASDSVQKNEEIRELIEANDPEKIKEYVNSLTVK